MLDMYAVPDEDELTDDSAPTGNRIIGSFTLQELNSLRNVTRQCWELGIVFSFTEDSRWTISDVAKVLEITRQCRSAGGGLDTIDKLIAVLERAIEQQCGIAAYCD